MKNIIDKIDNNHSLIKKHGKFNKDLLNKINYKFRLDWNYYSNHLEGGTLTKEETRSVMTDVIEIHGKPLKDVMEMRGHNEVITQIIKIGQAKNRISESKIKEIHKAIMYEDDKEKAKEIGKWKTKANEIINYKGEKIDFALPDEVANKMHTLLNKTNADLDAYFSNKKTEHPLKIAVQFHKEFLTIHPFYDGNGRTARILTNLILISCGYPPIIIKNENKETYYKLLADIQVYGGKIDLLENFLAQRMLASQQLVLDAIDGKNIEDIDDLDKEITLWKKNLVSDSVVPLSAQTLDATYLNSLRPLFIEFINKHQQFNDVFTSIIINNHINNISETVTELAYFDEKLIIGNDKQNPFIEPTDTPIEQSFNSIDNLVLNIRFKGFKNNGANTFNSSNQISINLNEFNYTIKARYGLINITKLYSETLTTIEINNIVNTLVKDFFNEIKSQINS